MAFNKFMHPRNIYRTPPDFNQLALDYPEFEQYVIRSNAGKARIDFKNNNALSALTKVLLKKDFGLDVELPSDRLVPAVPLRLNYILWIEDLLQAADNSIRHPSHTIHGIDIGTGASCIYPLLGAKKNNWKFLATEVDENAVTWAQKLVQKNNLEEKIRVIKVDPKSVLKDAVEKSQENYDFCMCNPPFFRDQSDVALHESSAKAKCIAADSERIYEGGEEVLVIRIIEDSKILRERVRIYTSMLGKKITFLAVKNYLRNCEGLQFTTTEFCQGNVKRWGIAWTFVPEIKLHVVKGIKTTKHKVFLLYPLPNPMQDLQEYTLAALTEKAKSLLDELEIEWKIVSDTPHQITFQLKAFRNTWIHQRRKRRELKMKREKLEHTDATEVEQDQNEIAEVSNNSVKHVNNTSMQDEVKESSSEHHESTSCMDEEMNTCVSQSQGNGTSDVPDCENQNGRGMKRLNDDDDCANVSVPKKPRIDSEELACEFKNSSGTDVATPLLFCQMSLVKVNDQRIHLTLHDADECGDRNSVHQLMQFFKNRLK